MNDSRKCGLARVLTFISAFGISLGLCGAADAATVTGSVRDSEGAPLAGAEVLLRGAGTSVSTDEQGQFTLAGVSPGRHVVEARLPGFTVAEEPVEVVEGQVAEITLQLFPVAALGNIEVVTSYSLLGGSATSGVALDSEQIGRMPHFGDDLYRVIGVMPGVTSNGASSQFNIRGGLAREALVQLDRQELFEPFHLKEFDGVFSIVDPKAVGGMDLLPGGFPAEYGDRSAGVVDMKTRQPTDSQIDLGLSLTTAWAGAAGVFGDDQRGDGRGDWLVSGRRGYLDIVLGLVGSSDEEDEEEAEFKPRYWDLFARTSYRFDDRNSLTFRLLAADDSFVFDDEDEGERTRIDSGYGNALGWLDHQVLFGSSTVLATTLSAGRVDRDRGISNEGSGDVGTIRDIRKMDLFTVRQDGAREIGDAHLLSFGLFARAFDSDYDYANSVELAAAIPDPRFPPPQRVTRYDDVVSSEQYGIYVSDRIRLTGRLTAELGVRGDRETLTDSDQISPRVNLMADLGRAGRMRFGWGHFYQSHRPNELDVPDGDFRFFPPEKSVHWTLGWERSFGTGWTAKLDAYRRETGNPRPRYENLFDPLSPIPEVRNDRVLLAPEESLAQGVELFARYAGARRWEVWGHYAWSETEDLLNGVWTPRSFDQTHAVTLAANLRPGEKWNLNLLWVWHTGWPTTAVSGEAVPRPDEGFDLVPVVGPFYQERHADYHRLDLRLSRDFKLRRGTMNLFIDVQNAYDQQNEAGFDFDRDSLFLRPDGSVAFEPEFESWLGILPSFGIGWKL